MRETVLKISDLSFGYGKSPNVLSNLNLDIKRGERLAIVGRNGAGKTTLLHLLVGLKRMRSGTIELGGEPVGYSRKELVKWRQKVGIVFQNPDDQVFAPTVEQDVSFGPLNLGLHDDEIEMRVTESLCAMGIDEYRLRSPMNLSGGEKKRVAIAGALAMNPEIILLDEPCSALDGDSRGLLESTLGNLTKADVTVVVSTHDMDFAWRWAERVIILIDGAIAGDGPARELLMNKALMLRGGLQLPLSAELAFLLRDKEDSASEARSAEFICEQILRRIYETS